MITVDGEVLEEIAPNVSGTKGARQNAIIAAVSEILQSTLADYEINTRLRVAHFVAQACHESDGFCTTEEYASGVAYEGRENLGNTHSGDGKRYKGRGLFQLTGRANYISYGKALNVDLVDDPTSAADPVMSLKIACEFWKEHKLNGFADADDLITITKRINGGLNGIESRRAYLAKAKTALARLAGAAVATPDPILTPVLRRGSKGEGVAKLQAVLHDKGFPIAVDGDFGAATELAAMQFQTSKKLTPDGIVGPATWSALDV
ncbi:peptidoglycan-binding protein [Mesorhizobium sp. M0482]|uniref:peptidoglycan-binding protein n=1 Tax=Mesorhizobium sp. M0482 TaxID=2956948 RepID=UPI003337D5EE